MTLPKSWRLPVLRTRWRHWRKNAGRRERAWPQRASGASNVREMSAEEIEREARVKDYIEKQEAKRVARHNNNYNRQVADLFDWITRGKEVVPAATNAIEKFSPEAKRMAKWRIKETIERLETLFAALGKGEVVEVEVEVEQGPEHVNGANGKAAA